MHTTPKAPAFPRCSLCAKDLWMENESWESRICKSCQPKPPVLSGNPLKDEFYPYPEDIWSPIQA